MGQPDFDPRQLRGDREAYDRYLAGMDASMRQKVALTAAHLLCTGRVADMGMGSGSGSHALAALYPSLHVVGVDMDPNMVAIAKEKYVLPNLEFVVGDVAEAIFEDGSLDGILDSSVLHHVTSFGGYRHQNAADCLAVQARALKTHGTLIVRDFLATEAGEAWLDVPADDGDDSSDPRRCSTAALLERLSHEWRCLSREPGFRLTREPVTPRDGWRRYRLEKRHATEFVLRKDYRDHWEAEVKEEYTYYTQVEFERVFASLGMRVLASTPLHNPWIVHRRFEGKIALREVDDGPMGWPPTHYFIVGEKVPVEEGVRFREAGAEEPPGYLEMMHYQHRHDRHVRDLVRRPYVTVDVVPFFETPRGLQVLARMSYPRPILASASTRSLDGSRPPHYVTEPLNVLQTDRSFGETVERMLSEHVAIAANSLRGFYPGATYYPSPGGTQEEVRSVLVHVDPVLVEERIPNVSGWSTSGRIRALAAEQVLRAAQVGALPDARLELCVYELLLQQRREPSAWIGDEIALRPTESLRVITDLRALQGRAPRRVFERVGRTHSAGFLSIRRSIFEELDAGDRLVASQPLEYVEPSRHSVNTIACALLARKGGEVFLGVVDDDLPAAQCFVGNSQLLVAPAWRIPRDVASETSALGWVLRRLTEVYGVTVGRAFGLGGRYYPSAGMSPEVVHPVAIEVLADGPGGEPIHWVTLASVAHHRGALLDGHLRIVAFRAAHALGLLVGRQEAGSM
jgi:ubiquinone/menaquinone biosynthesis C-methylase UbiE